MCGSVFAPVHTSKCIYVHLNSYVYTDIIRWMYICLCSHPQLLEHNAPFNWSVGVRLLLMTSSNGMGGGGGFVLYLVFFLSHFLFLVPTKLLFFNPLNLKRKTCKQRDNKAIL